MSKDDGKHLLLGGSAPCLQNIFVLDGHTFNEGFVDTRIITLE